MNYCRIKFSWILLSVATGLLFLSGAMTVTANAGDVFPCANESDITKTISSEASLEEFTCVTKKYEGMDTLHFNVAVKNISSEDQRFKVNIFLDNGKAVGGLLPRTTKKGLIKPGEIEKFTYPVMAMSAAPGKIDVIIKTMSK